MSRFRFSYKQRCIRKEPMMTKESMHFSVRTLLARVHCYFKCCRMAAELQSKTGKLCKEQDSGMLKQGKQSKQSVV